MTAGVWDDFFPFPTGEELLVEAKILLFTLRGTGRVEARSDEELSLTLQIPEQSIMGQEVPTIDLELAFTYRQEGPGNPAVVTYNGKRKEDQSVTITSDMAEKRRHIEPSIAIGGKSIAWSIYRTGDRKAEIRDVTGLDLPFKLKILLKAV